MFLLSRLIGIFAFLGYPQIVYNNSTSKKKTFKVDLISAAKLLICLSFVSSQRRSKQLSTIENQKKKTYTRGSVLYFNILLLLLLQQHRETSFTTELVSPLTTNKRYRPIKMFVAKFNLKTIVKSVLDYHERLQKHLSRTTTQYCK